MTHAMVCGLVCDCTGTLSSLPCVFPGCQGHVHPQCSPGSSFQTTSDPPSLLFFWTGNDLPRSAVLRWLSVPESRPCNVFIYSKCYLPGSLYSLSPSCSHILWKNHLESGSGAGFYHSPLQVMRKMMVLLQLIYKSAKQCWGTCSAQGAVQIPT